MISSPAPGTRGRRQSDVFSQSTIAGRWHFRSRVRRLGTLKERRRLVLVLGRPLNVIMLENELALAAPSDLSRLSVLPWAEGVDMTIDFVVGKSDHGTGP